MFKCSSCESEFKNRSNLNKHIKSRHSKDENLVFEYYNCPICNKPIKLKSSLFRHLKRVHANRSTINISDIKPKLPLKNNQQRPVLTTTYEKNTVNESSVVGSIFSTKESQLSRQALDSKLQEELDVHIDKILNYTSSSTCPKQNKDVDNLVKELDLNAKKELAKPSNEVCLSIPDFSENDQEITLGNVHR